MRFPVLPAAASATLPQERPSHDRSALLLPVVAEARLKRNVKKQNHEEMYPLPFFLGSEEWGAGSTGKRDDGLKKLHVSSCKVFPGGSVVKNPPANAKARRDALV